jgi:hypothetical protein
MNRLKLLALTLLFSGCGVTIHSDPIKVNPIVVQGQVNIDLAQVLQQCVNQCNKTPDDATATNKCITDCYNNFLQIYSVAAVSVK